MKNLFIKFLLLFVLASLSAHADEGMWLPLLLKKYNEADMQSKGLKLSAEDIYSVNNASLKDAVVRFGGGCTGELISAGGLLLTNHHCGYSSIQNHSTVEKDYLKDGFWAMDRNEELPNSGLTATFLVRMEDVTEQVLEGVTDEMSESQRESIITVNSRDIEKTAEEGNQYRATVKAFYYGSEFYMFVTETYRDVRLVGAPPSSIGKFGGDTDNWMWPRHTGDFSLFRIYANINNEPADYSPSNVPYKPKHHFPISLSGVKENDFTMIFGFPGRTEEYLTSFAVERTLNVVNPIGIKIREQKLKLMKEEMNKSREVWLKYAGKYASISNYYKKWKGENRGLKKLDAIAKKQAQEEQFQQWANGTVERKAKYGNLLPRFEAIYTEQEKYEKALALINEAAFGIDLILYAYRFQSLERTSQSEYATNEEVASKVKSLQEHAEKRFQNYYPELEKKMFPALIEIYFNETDESLQPDIYNTIMKKYKGDYQKYANHVLSKSIFTDKGRMDKFLSSYKKSSVKKLLKDPGYALFNAIFTTYQEKIKPENREAYDKLDVMMRTYIQGLREMQDTRIFYPDANSTLRLSYGKVEGYFPNDSTEYQPFTHLEGMMDKYKPGDEEFDIPEKLIQLYKTKDYGRYGYENKMPVCFIASNHTTGGNSGSPIINGEGQLVGTNFDRNWEGTMSDIMYDPTQVRNISVDIRYTLFIIDKFAGASHLINEMTLVN